MLEGNTAYGSLPAAKLKNDTVTLACIRMPLPGLAYVIFSHSPVKLLVLCRHLNTLARTHLHINIR